MEAAVEVGDLAHLREHPECIYTADEAFFRLAIPLTHIGRVCPVKTDVRGFEVEAGCLSRREDRVALQLLGYPTSSINHPTFGDYRASTRPINLFEGPRAFYTTQQGLPQVNTV